MAGKPMTEEMVECHYNGAIIYIPLNLFLRMTMRVNVEKKKFTRYKEGAYLYSMSQREFYDLAHDADAVYKRDRMALINLDILDDFMEYYREKK